MQRPPPPCPHGCTALAELPALAAYALTRAADAHTLQGRAYLQANAPLLEQARQVFAEAATHYRLAEEAFTQAGHSEYAQAASEAADSLRLVGQNGMDHDTPLNAVAPLLNRLINAAIKARWSSL